MVTVNVIVLQVPKDEDCKIKTSKNGDVVVVKIGTFEGGKNVQLASKL